MGSKPIKEASTSDKAALALGVIKAINEDRRVSRRNSEITLCMVIDGRAYSTINWSLTGVLLRDVTRGFAEGSHVPFTLYAAGHDDNYFTGIGRIVRQDASRGHMVVKFDALGAGLSSWLADRL